MRPRMYGPRSLILTMTERRLSRFVTFAEEASGSQRCAAVAVKVSRLSPLAVGLPTWSYHEAFPNWLDPATRTGPQQGSGALLHAFVTGSKLMLRCATHSEP